MKYELDPTLKRAYQEFYKWLKTPTEQREVIVGDPVSFFIKKHSK